MKRTLLLILLVTVGVSLGLLIQMDPGYLLVSYQSMTFETTLWFALLSLIAVISLGVITLKLFKRIITSPARIRRWMAYRQEKQAESCTHLALDSFLQHDWQNAINHAKNAAKSSNKPEQMQLFAAICASLSNRHDYARDLLLNHQKLDLTQRIVDATLLINESKWDIAKLQLKQLQQERPYHAGISRLLLQTYQALSAWQPMQDLALIARKHQLLEANEQRHFDTTALWHLFALAETQEAIDSLWAKVSRDLKNEPIIIAAYLEALGRTQQWDSLSKKIKKYVTSPHDKLILKTALPLCQHDSKAIMKWITNLEKKFEPHANFFWLKAECLRTQDLAAMAKAEAQKGLELTPDHAELIALNQSL